MDNEQFIFVCLNAFKAIDFDYPEFEQSEDSMFCVGAAYTARPVFIGVFSSDRSRDLISTGAGLPLFHM